MGCFHIFNSYILILFTFAFPLESGEKTCLATGKWFGLSSGQEWTNYSNCATGFVEDQKRRTFIHITVYSISILSVLPALCIFFGKWKASRYEFKLLTHMRDQFYGFCALRSFNFSSYLPRSFSLFLCLFLNLILLLHY
jgi:hypothetical protein